MVRVNVWYGIEGCPDHNCNILTRTLHSLVNFTAIIIPRSLPMSTPALHWPHCWTEEENVSYNWTLTTKDLPKKKILWVLFCLWTSLRPKEHKSRLWWFGTIILITQFTVSSQNYGYSFKTTVISHENPDCHSLIKRTINYGLQGSTVAMVIV